MTELPAEPTRLVDDPNTPTAVAEHLRCAMESPPAMLEFEAGAKRLAEATSSAAAPVAAASRLKLVVVSAVAAVGAAGVLAQEPKQQEKQARSDPPATAHIDPPPGQAPLPPPGAPESPSAQPSSHGSTVDDSYAAVPGPVAVPENADPRNGEVDSNPGEAPRKATRRRPGDSRDEPVRAADVPPVRAADPQPARHPAIPPKEPATDNSVRREIAQLQRARKLLSTSPAQAWSLIREGEQQFSNGALVEERAALAIEVLLALGREGDAKKRAERYLRHYPNGTSAVRIRALVPGVR